MTDKKWKVVSYIPTASLYQQKKTRSKTTTIIVIILLSISFLMSWTIARSRHKSAIANEKLAMSEKSLRESNATKDKFFSIIAHDLRGPFSSILGLSKIIVKSYDSIKPEKTKLYLETINKELSKTYSLLENLLSWSRSQRDSIKINKESINLHIIAEETIGLLQQIAEQKEIELINRIEVNLVANTDKELITTVVRNLLSNAIKFTRQQGKISIESCRKEQDTIELKIIDNGVGMSNEKQNKLFKIGENISTPGTNDENGTGLGLIVCKEFVEKLGGEIGVHSEIGIGSSFYFTITTT